MALFGYYYYCISFIGVLIISLVVNLALNLVVSDDNEYKNHLHGFVSAVLWIWWLLGFVATCDEVLGYQIGVTGGPGGGPPPFVP